MAYFSNGTEGECYEAEYCSGCVNFRTQGDEGGDGCAILDLHLQWNYDQITAATDSLIVLAAATKHEALEHFIPTDKGDNKQCRMFLPIDEVISGIEDDDSGRQCMMCSTVVKAPELCERCLND